MPLIPEFVLQKKQNKFRNNGQAVRSRFFCAKKKAQKRASLPSFTQKPSTLQKNRLTLKMIISDYFTQKNNHDIQTI